MSKRVTNLRWREGFRETFLVVFTRKADAAALRRLALLLTELYRDAAPRWWPSHKRGDVDAILRAAVADLRHLRYVLEWAGEGVSYSALGNAYAQLARDSSGDAEKIAAAIEAALADPKGTLERHRATLDTSVSVFFRPQEVAV
ncbi:MAG: hypothetical protein WAM82_10360 [Thermoanaerobaculia bacterium]